MVVFGGRRGAAGDPIEDVGIGALEQRLVAIELSLVKPGEMSIGETAEDQIALARPAVPGAEQQPLAANSRMMRSLAVLLAVARPGI